MTIAPERDTFVPARELPNGQVFYSPYGVFPYQADGVAEIIARTDPGMVQGQLPVFDAGMGKTVMSLAAGAFLFAAGGIDQMLVIAGRGLVEDWRKAAETFTSLSVFVYHGPGREKRLARFLAEHGRPHVFITSYETGAAELVNGTRRRIDGPLLGTLGLRGQRTLTVFDEVTKLKTRSSKLHKDYFWLLSQLRNGAWQRVIGLTATPMTKDFGDGYNIARLCAPSEMPLVGEFEERFIRGFDDYGHPIFNEARKEEFARLFRRVMIRKRKTDPDVAPLFPRQHEAATHVTLDEAQRDFYGAVRDSVNLEAAPNPKARQAAEQRLWNLMRLTAGHPAAHLHASNPASRAVTRAFTPDELRAIGSPKVTALLAQLRAAHERGWPVVVFSFYTTVLIELERELAAAGLSYVVYHGGQSQRANEAAKATFMAGGTDVFLTSDAAAEGQNLQVSPMVIEYESAVTFKNRVQRINRVNRLTSDWSDVYCHTLIADKTIEDGIAGLVMRRNEDQDVLLGDKEDGSGFVSARERRRLLDIRPGE